MPRRLLYAALPLLVPLLLLGPVLLRGERFLPLVPTVLEPLASEQPEAAAAARASANWVQSDRLFPVLTDQRAIRADLAAGELPLWAPELGAGLPLAAGSITGPLYPPNAVALLAAPEDAAGPLALVTLVLAGLGLWLFLGRVGVDRGPRVVAVLGLQLGSWAVGNLYYPMKIDAALWVPFALWAVEGLAQAKRGSGAVLALATAAGLLAGFPTVAVFGVALVAAYGVVRLAPLNGWASPGLGGTIGVPAEGPPPTLPPLLAAALAGALGLGLSLVVLLPLLEASGQSRRTTTSQEALESQALPTTAFLGLVVHDLVASPTDATPPGHHAVAWWLISPGDTERAMLANQLEWNTFVGVGVLALGLVGAFAGGRRARFPAVLLLLVIGFACAWPLVRLAYRLPGFDVGAPTRVLSLAWILWPWLAALGVQALVDRVPRATTTLAGTTVVLTVLLGGWSLLFDVDDWRLDWERLMIERYVESPDFGETEESIRQRIPVDAQSNQARNLAHSLRVSAFASLGLCLATALVLRSRGRGQAWSWAPLALLVLAEGMVAANGHVSGVPDAAGPTFPETESMRALREAAGDGRVLRLDTSDTGVAQVVDLARPNLPHGYGIGDLTPYSVFTPRLLIELWRAVDEEAYATTYGTFSATLRSIEHVGHPILDLLRATAVLSAEPLVHPRLEPVLEREGFHVYRRTGAFPPARVCQMAFPTQSTGFLLEKLGDPIVDPQTTALVGHEHGTIHLVRDESSSDSPWRPGTVELERPANDVVEVSVRDGSGGLLVVHDQWYPGWHATLDGESVPILRVDHAFRGIVLPPGDHRVRMTYGPSSLKLGALLSLLSLAAVLVLARHPA